MQFDKRRARARDGNYVGVSRGTTVGYYTIPSIVWLGLSIGVFADVCGGILTAASVSRDCHRPATLISALITSSPPERWTVAAISLHSYSWNSSAGVMPNISHCQITRSTRFARQGGIIKPNPKRRNEHLRTRLREIAHAQWGADASYLALRVIWYYTGLPCVKLAFHDADNDILARTVARMFENVLFSLTTPVAVNTELRACDSSRVFLCCLSVCQTSRSSANFGLNAI